MEIFHLNKMNYFAFQGLVVQKRVKSSPLVNNLQLNFICRLVLFFEATLQVKTILVAMATKILELATELEPKSPAWQLKLRSKD